MVVATANRVVLNADPAIQINRYVIFRPIGSNEPQRRWRTEALKNGIVSPIPSFMVPMEARFIRFPHDRYPSFAMERAWKDIDSESEVYQELYLQFSDILLSLDRQQLRQGYGVYGLYSYAGNARKLQSVHLVLPMGVYQDRGHEVPLLAICCRAPWNNSLEEESISYAQWRRQRWGIDLAVFIHAISVYFRNNPASLERDIALASRLGFVFPTTSEKGTSLVFPVREQLEYIQGLDAPELEGDLGIFGMELEDLSPSALCGFESLGKEWTIYGALTQVQTAVNVLKAYNYWMRKIYKYVPNALLLN